MNEAFGIQCIALVINVIERYQEICKQCCYVTNVSGRNKKGNLIH